MAKKIVDSFIVGGTKAGPSLPGPRLQRMIGTRIIVSFMLRQLCVPTNNGPVMAGQGDRIVLYDDDTLEVERNASDP